MKPMIYDPDLGEYVAEILEATCNGGCTLKEARRHLGMTKPQIEHAAKTGEFPVKSHGFVMDKYLIEKSREGQAA